MQRMLLISPAQEDVSGAAEIELLGAAIHAVPLTGAVTGERLTRATSGERFTILHIAAHGDEEGVALSDGRLDKERLAQLARHVRADLVFLNACRSAALGQYLACQGVPAVIAYTAAALDRDALRTASYYYEELVALGMDYHRAFEKVSPCDGSLAWFAGAGFVERAVEPLLASVALLRHDLDAAKRTLFSALAVSVVVNLLAVGALLVAAMPGVYGQTIPPSPLESPLEMATVADPPTPTRAPTRKREDAEPATATMLPTSSATASSTASATATPSATPSPTSTPTPRPTVALPTLTPDYPATVAALPPCLPE